MGSNKNNHSLLFPWVSDWHIKWWWGAFSAFFLTSRMVQGSICLSKGFILCPLFVLHEKKASQRGEFSSWECTWRHAGTHAKSTCTHTPLATSSIRTLVAERWGPRYAPGWQISSRRIQSSLSLWPSGHLLWIKSRKGHRPHHLRFHKQLRRV